MFPKGGMLSISRPSKAAEEGSGPEAGSKGGGDAAQMADCSMLLDQPGADGLWVNSLDVLFQRGPVLDRVPVGKGRVLSPDSQSAA